MTRDRCVLQVGIPILENFLVRLQQGYSKYGNPYHNLVHAADVTQTMHYVISRSGLSVRKKQITENCFFSGAVQCDERLLG
jgi:hypothetical protein